MGFLSNVFGRMTTNNDKQQRKRDTLSTTSHDDVQYIIARAQKCEQDQNIDEAMEWYRKAADCNNPIGLYKLGVFYNDSGDDGSAFEYLRKAADYGHGSACYFMAKYYMDGKIVAKDEEKAFDYYKKSAELGESAGQAFLGMFYLDGIGTPPDEEAAFYWLSNCPDIDWSGLGLCKCYLFGRGVEKNINKGISILINIAGSQSSNMFVKDARQLVRECAKQGMPVPQEFLSEIEEADKRSSALIDELLATFEDMEFDSEGLTENIIVLTDENGEDVRYEFLDLIEYKNQEYVVLLPVDEEADEVVILKVELDDNNQENYISVDNQKLLNVIYHLFKEKNKNSWDFVE